MQQQNVSSVKRAAATAKKDADSQRDTAMQGRVLATVVQAGRVAHPLRTRVV